jgi:hypothetical protein
MLTSTPTVSAEELAQELEKVPEQYWANLLQIIRLFRESVAPIPGDYSRNYAISEAIEDIGLVHQKGGWKPRPYRTALININLLYSVNSPYSIDAMV